MSINRALKIRKNHAGFSDRAASALFVVNDFFNAIQFVRSDDNPAKRNAARNGSGARAGDGDGDPVLRCS